MQALTEDDLGATFVNASDEELRNLTVPMAFYIADWDHHDFYAWRDPRNRGRGYLVVELEGKPTGVALRSAEGSSRARSALCNLCHTMQPADQVVMFSARRAGKAGERGDSIGTMMCADLACHETARLTAPLAPGEMRSNADRRAHATRERAEAFVEQIRSDG